MAYKVMRSEVPARLTAKANFMCGGLTADSIGAAYHVRSYGVLVGLITADGTAHFNTTRYTVTTAGHVGIFQQLFPKATGLSQAQMHKAASK